MSTLPKLRFHLGYLFLAILLFLLEIAIAKYTAGWIRNYIGDILVVILMYSTIMSIAHFNKKTVVLFTLIFAFMIEFSQYFQLAEHLGFEQGSMAYIILGNTFSPEDLICYLIGGLIIFLVENYTLDNLL